MKQIQNSQYKTAEAQSRRAYLRLFSRCWPPDQQHSLRSACQSTLR